ncbi:hypothetical protein TcYC6_0067260 [Trypanosoma cruzi]|nr:hypothetical protein TcYC6_0067260 [Trypanosoma cruzi]
MQDTSRKQKAYESYDCSRGASSGSLECHGAFHKAGCVEARCSNSGEIQFGPTRDPAVGEARRPVRPFPEHSSVNGELHHNADPGIVAGCIDVKGRNGGRAGTLVESGGALFLWFSFSLRYNYETHASLGPCRAVPFFSVLFYIRQKLTEDLG